jgi:hypothetical protein
MTRAESPPLRPSGARLDWLGFRLALTLSLISLLWSTALITNFSFELIGPEKLGLVFNDMASRLLHLDWTIDPDLISFEAFVRDGRTYTYFGIFPALLRMPAIVFGWGAYPLARLSCLLALWTVTFATLRMTQFALGSTLRTPAARRLAAAALLGSSFSGPVIYVLASASIYHEAIFWAGAFTAIFNAVAVRGLSTGRLLSTKILTLLALVAGCALLTRLTAGIVLYGGLALLLAWPTVSAFAQDGPRSGTHKFLTALRQAPPALVIMAAFCAAQAIVNYGRWGSPYIGFPLQYYRQAILDPRRDERLASFARHGALDFVRIPFAALHYGFGLKVDVLFPSILIEHFDGIEGPRLAAVLCVPWMIVCAAVALWSICRHSKLFSPIVPLILANGFGFLVMLSIPWLCLRYTFDGWGFVSLAAALGTKSLAHRADSLGGTAGAATRRVGQAAIIMTVFGILVSDATLLRYKINYSGTAPAVRYWLSAKIQPMLCPNAPLTPNLRLTDFMPLVTPRCPPLW